MTVVAMHTETDNSMMRILAVMLQHESDVVLARQRARLLATFLAFDVQDQTRIATAVSEIARNALSYAGEGKVEFYLEDKSAPQVLLIRISDQGPGIAMLQPILDGQYTSSTGMGIGILGARRLMDQCDIVTSATEGTTVTLKKCLPQTSPVLTAKRLARLTDTLASQCPQSLLEEVQLQNHELLRTLDELRQKQEALVRLNRELEETNRGVVALYADLDEKADHLRRANNMKSHFLSNMSHEFRVPINTMLSLSRLLLDHVDGELTVEQTKQVGFIQKAAEDLTELVNDLLDLAKIEAGKIAVQPAEFDVATLFGTLRGILRPLLQHDSVQLIFDKPVGIPTLITDESKVAQILLNFISNALKYTEQGEVRVSAALRSEGDVVILAVADTGIGIAPEDQETIFEEFTQLEHPLQKRIKGTGLGLALCKKLAILLGGYVTLESELGVGSTFSVVIPWQYRPSEVGPPEAHIAQHWEPPEPAVLVAEDEDATPQKPAEMILIIDDDEAARYVLKQRLAATPYTFKEAATGQEGLRLVRTQPPHVVFLDLHLPDMVGFEVLEQLKADPATQHIPIMVYTAQVLDQGEREYLTARGAVLLSKDEASLEKIRATLEAVRHAESGLH